MSSSGKKQARAGSSSNSNVSSSTQSLNTESRLQNMLMALQTGSISSMLEAANTFDMKYGTCETVPKGCIMPAAVHMKSSDS